VLKIQHRTNGFNHSKKGRRRRRRREEKEERCTRLPVGASDELRDCA